MPAVNDKPDEDFMRDGEPVTRSFTRNQSYKPDADSIQNLRQPVRCRQANALTNIYKIWVYTEMKRYVTVITVRLNKS